MINLRLDYVECLPMSGTTSQSLDPLSERVHDPMVPVDLIVGGVRRDDLFGSLRRFVLYAGRMA